jgi:CubicO group peptidase (beta-lactamase class C family)
MQHNWWHTLTAQMPGWLNDAHTPGAAIAIIECGQPAQACGFGLRAADTLVPVTPDTVFEAASLSKPLFACAVVDLFAQGLLDPDASLNDLLREPLIPNEPRLAQITARRVLSHTSGLPNWRWEKDEDFWQWDRPISLRFSPGERWSYSGEGFVYLQRAVEQLTDQPLEAYMQQHWLQPLGMGHTSYTWQPAFETAYACGHDPDGNPLPKERPTKANSATSLHTTVLDYARLVQRMLAEPDGARQREMLTPQVTIQPGTAWGLGWGLQRIEPGWVFWQWGDNTGFKHLVAGSREQGVGLVILTNGENGYQVWRNVLAHTLDPESRIFTWLSSI